MCRDIIVLRLVTVWINQELCKLNILKVEWRTTLQSNLHLHRCNNVLRQVTAQSIPTKEISKVNGRMTSTSNRIYSKTSHQHLTTAIIIHFNIQTIRSIQSLRKIHSARQKNLAQTSTTNHEVATGKETMVVMIGITMAEEVPGATIDQHLPHQDHADHNK